MRKGLLIIIACMVSTMLSLAQGPLSRSWEKSAAKPLGDTVPTWFGTDLTRGMAWGNNHLYVVSRASGNHIYVVDQTSGLILRELSTTGMSGGTYVVSDAETSSDGQILVCNLTTNASTSAFKIYNYVAEDSLPKLYLSYTGDPARLGDKFTVIGDLKGTASIYAAASAGTAVYRWDVTGGVLNTTPTKITVSRISEGKANFGTTPVVAPITAGPSSDFWLNGNVMAPCKYSSTGTFLDSIPSTKIETTSNAIQYFTYNGKNYLAAFLYKFGATVNNYAKLVILDVNARDTLQLLPTLGINNNTNATGDVEVVTGPDNALAVFFLGTNNGFACWANPTAPYVEGVSLNGIPKLNNYLIAKYTYKDINRDVEGATTIKWYISDSPTGTFTEIAGQTNDSLFLAEGGNYLNKYVYFEVTPVASTGTVLTGTLVKSAVSGQIAAGDPPVASAVSIQTDHLLVGDTLTGNYTYSDPNGDLEGVSTFKWYRGETSDGTGKVVITGATSKTYIMQDADFGKYLFFEVTPVALTGILLTGNPVTAVTSDTIGPRPPVPPVASNLDISGRLEVGATLSGSYTYSDLNKDPEGTSLFKWYRGTNKNGSGKTAITNATEKTYKLVADDLGKWIFFEVTPDAVSASDTLGLPVFVVSDTVIAPQPEPVAPVASDVKLFGKPEKGVVMYGTYVYSDRTDDPEGATIFKWYRADDAAGANKVQITGADESSYVVSSADVGKYIIFEVTPVATIEPFNGTPVAVTAPTAVVDFTSTNTFERVWVRNHFTSSIPNFIGTGNTERGMAVGNGKVYIASRLGGTKVIVLDAADGSYEGQLNTTGISGGTFPINDVETSEDGQILACNLAGDTKAGPFKVYKWETEASEPTVYINFSTSDISMRLGDRLTVQGDISGDAIIWTAASASKYVVRWVVTGGILGNAEIINLESQGITALGSSPTACGLSLSTQDGFIVNGRSINPTLIDKDFVKVGTYPFVEDAVAGLQSTTPKVFDFKGRKLVAFYQIGNLVGNLVGQRAIVMDVTKKPSEIVASDVLGYTEYMWDVKQELGDIHVEVDGDNFNIYVLTANDGFGKFTGTIVLPEVAHLSTAYDGKYVLATFSKTMADPTGADTNFVVKADGVEIAVDSVKLDAADATKIKVYVATTLTDAQEITLEYVPGNIRAADGMPLNAFGPDAVENLVNASAPKATSVTVTGEVKIGALVTGSYTFEDANGDEEGTSKFKWYYATNDQGTGKLTILGETAKTYTISKDMLGKYIAFQVTPVAVSGGAEFLEGETVLSPWYLVLSNDIDNSSAGSILMFPNPVVNNLTIIVSEQVNTIEVINTIGKVVYRTQRTSNQMSIDMKAAQKGIYMVRFGLMDGSSVVRKIVKE